MASSHRGPSVEETLTRASEQFERREWGKALTSLLDVGVAALGIDDLERLAVAAYLTGDDAQSDDAWTLGYEQCLADGDPTRAARCAFWLGFNFLLRGDMARSNAWLSRARARLDDGKHESAVDGLLLVVDGLEQVDTGEPRAALPTFERAAAIGQRFGDRDVLALAQLGRGQALIAQAEITRGTACLDEAMVTVLANEVSAPVAGIVYCAVLLECRHTFDAARAQEWTEALTRWCLSQPDLVPYRGQCLVHRSEVLALQGKWPDALEEARRACVQLAGHPAIGEAYYQQAEMHRLRGEVDAAEAAYRDGSRFGREPHPGLALLRLAQGDVASALASIRRVVAEEEGRARRFRSLAALAEIALAANDLDEARAAAAELADIASGLDAPLLIALARHAEGSILLAEGAVSDALPPLRAALAIWQQLGAPYESARERALIAVACGRLGDAETSRFELDEARVTFEALGAASDVAAILARGATVHAAPRPAGLTVREVEVLALVATGMSNHEIAVRLVISDHTVRRHLQNIFGKAGVSTRAAATAYAFEHGVVSTQR